MTSRATPSNFVKNVLQNGVGRHVCQLQRLTLNFCKSHAGSRGMRDFIENFLIDFTKKNPGVVVYLKPRRHRSPRIVATYLNGNSKVMNVHMMSKEDICKWVEHARTKSGVEIVRLRKMWHTDNPSIQGPWHPMVNKDTSRNLRTFPDTEISRLQEEPGTQHHLLEIAKQLREMKIQELSSSDLDNKNRFCFFSSSYVT